MGEWAWPEKLLAIIRRFFVLSTDENIFLLFFLRKEIGAVCREFVRRNGVRQIYIPTNGYFTQRTIASVEDMLAEPDLALLAIELSLDGMAEYHDAFRVSRGSFDRAMETYDALAKIRSSRATSCDARRSTPIRSPIRTAAPST